MTTRFLLLLTILTMSTPGFSQVSSLRIPCAHSHDCCSANCGCCPEEIFFLDNYAIKKKVAIINTSTNDTTYGLFPTNIKTGKVSITIENCAKTIPFFNFLRGVKFRRPKNQSNKKRLLRSTLSETERYDSQGRIASYCVAGWYDMSSLPWVIYFEYYENSNLVKDIIHTDYLIHGDKSYEKTCQSFQYDSAGNIIQIDLYTNYGDFETTLLLIP